MSARLHPDMLARLPASVRRFGYRREQHGVGIVHLGIGNFHRAHQAVYVDEAIERAGGDWRIVGVSCRAATVRAQLEPQDGLYSLLEADGHRAYRRIIGSIERVLVAPQDPAAVIAAIAAARTRLVTLTITEKGYCRDAGGRLDCAHPDIVHDLAHPDTPRSAPGLLLAGLRQRRANGAGALSVLSCDNLAHNGAVTAAVLDALARQQDEGLADWIAKTVTFPSSMVDRIVPATTAADLDLSEQVLGLRDEGFVRTEPFTQWVIEERFAAGRPALEHAGATLVDDVRPWELAKLRLLNGSHSTLAYLGTLAGYAFVHEAIADPDLRALVVSLMRDELQPTLPPIPGFDHAAYCSAMLERFANSTLQHRLLQIAMDGSQKLPQRLLPAAEQRLARGEGIEAIALAVAAWMQFVDAARSSPGALDDPLVARLDTALAGAGEATAIVDALLSLSEIFGDELPRHSAFRAMLVGHLDVLRRQGVGTAVRRLLAARSEAERGS